MDFNWIWKAVLIIVAGTFLLRFAGRKSISQMTLAQTVIMIGIGSLLVQPLSDRNIWVTIGVGAVLILTLIGMEYGQIKSDKMESFITGKSKMVIENGEVDIKNLRKMRLTVDQLEMKLRQGNVARITDVKWATLEPNGQIGFILKDHLQPATKQDVEQIKNDIEELKMLFNQRLPKVKLITKYNEPAVETPPASQKQENDKPDIFSEVNYKSHETPPPKYLQ